MNMNLQALQRYTEEKLGVARGVLTKEDVADWQQQQLEKTVSYVQECSPFFRKLLQGAAPQSFEEFSWLPFTYPEDYTQNKQHMLCVPEEEVAVWMTKRQEEDVVENGVLSMAFSQEDVEEIVRVLAAGFSPAVTADDRVMVLLPHREPGAPGNVVRRAVESLGATVYPMGFLGSLSYNTVLDLFYEKEITSVVGLPEQLRELMRYTTRLSLDSAVLFCNTPRPGVVGSLQEAWGCRIYEHFGRMETGFVGAFDGGAGDGYHLADSVLFVEIVDPENGEVLEDGRWGEVTVTTLGRTAMPLVRYRTGDIGRIAKEKDSCGCPLTKLHRVKEGIENRNRI